MSRPEGTRSRRLVSALSRSGVFVFLCATACGEADHQQSSPGPSTGGASTGGSVSTGGVSATGGMLLPLMDIVGLVLGDQGHCITKPVPVDENGRMLCTVSELPSSKVCDCSIAGRGELAVPRLEALRGYLGEQGYCADAATCETFCACEVLQPEGSGNDPASDLWACQNELAPNPALEGICFIDLEAPVPFGSSELLPANCNKDGSRRITRTVGANTPLPALPDGSLPAIYVMDCLPQ
jgi:hypothetical protein